MLQRLIEGQSSRLPHHKFTTLILPLTLVDTKTPSCQRTTPMKNCYVIRKSWLDAWHVNPSASKEYDLIDGLRGVAILIVLLGHQLYANAKPTDADWIRFLYYFINPGFGVTIFFALSGFLIAIPFWKLKISKAKEVIPCGYGWRRFWKIYPPLALSVVFFASVGTFDSRDFSYVDAAIKWLTGWSLLLPVAGALNGVMWTLAVEVQFYFILPLLFFSLKRTSPSQCRWLLFFIFAVVPTIARWLCYDGIPVILKPNINTHFPANLDSFAIGVFVAGLECQRKLAPSRALWGDLGFVLLAIVFGLSAWIAIHSYPMPLLQETARWCAMTAGGLLTLYVADPQHPRSRMLCQPWLRWCGLISYELYLFHQPPIIWIRETFGYPQGNLLKLGLQTVVTAIPTFALAALIYWYFSLPVLKYGRSQAPAHPTAKSSENNT